MASLPPNLMSASYPARYMPGAIYPVATPVTSSSLAMPDYPNWPMMPASASLPVAAPMAAPQRLRAEKHKEAGNHYRHLQLNGEAIGQYMLALQADPTYTDAYYNLGKTYQLLGDKPQAIESFHRLLQINPDDHESRVIMAQMLEEVGQYSAAQAHYRYVLARSPYMDPAQRRLAMLENRLLAQSNPAEADRQYQIRCANNQEQARQLMLSWFQRQMAQQQKPVDPELLKVLQAIPLVFALTQRVGQMENMAEYDHNAGVIRMSPELAFANPNVLAAYWVHELQHAADGDGLSSVMEEQDGYRELARFWQQFKGNVSDSNLDLALSLYQSSPDALDSRVRDLYTMRDPLLPEKSPGHGMARQGGNPVWLLNYESEKMNKYTRWVQERMKSLLPDVSF